MVFNNNDDLIGYVIGYSGASGVDNSSFVVLIGVTETNCSLIMSVYITYLKFPASDSIWSCKIFIEFKVVL